MAGAHVPMASAASCASIAAVAVGGRRGGNLCTSKHHLLLQRHSVWVCVRRMAHTQLGTRVVGRGLCGVGRVRTGVCVSQVPEGVRERGTHTYVCGGVRCGESCGCGRRTGVCARVWGQGRHMFSGSVPHAFCRTSVKGDDDMRGRMVVLSYPSSRACSSSSSSSSSASSSSSPSPPSPQPPPPSPPTSSPSPRTDAPSPPPTHPRATPPSTRPPAAHAHSKSGCSQRDDRSTAFIGDGGGDGACGTGGVCVAGGGDGGDDDDGGGGGGGGGGGVDVDVWTRDSYYDVSAKKGRRGSLRVDVHSVESYCAAHVQESVNIPLEDLAARVYELPPPYEDVIEIRAEDEGQAEQAMTVLTSSGWRCVVGFIGRGAGDASRYAVPRPTNVVPSDVSCTSSSAPSSSSSSSSSSSPSSSPPSSCPTSSSPPSPYPPSPSPSATPSPTTTTTTTPLFPTATHTPTHALSTAHTDTPTHTDSTAHIRPNPFLEMVAEDIVDWTPRPAHAAVVDVGCGGGRDALWLTKLLLRHTPITQRLTPQSHGGDDVTNGHAAGCVYAVDNHTKALQRAKALAERACVSPHMRVLNMDLRRPNAGPALLEATGGPAWLIHGSRFLDRRLLFYLRDHAVVAGGYVVWSTFMEGEEENRAPPFRPSRRLAPGELEATFREGPYDVLHYSEGQLVTRGVPVPAAFLVACRR